MIPYFLLLGIPLGVSLISLRSKTKIKKETWQKIVISIFFVGWILLLSLRHKSVGIDLEFSYLPTFKSVRFLSWKAVLNNEKMEVGYMVFMKLLSYISTNETFFLTIVAIITVGPIFYLYYKESENAMLTITILISCMFSMYFSGIRQCMAMAFAVPAYYMVKKKKLIPFLLLVFAACLFHKSAFVMFAIYPIYFAKIRLKDLPFVAVAVLVVFLFNKQIFNFLTGFLDEYADKYGKTEETNAYALMLLLVIFMIYSFFTPQQRKTDRNIIGLRNLLIFSVCLQFFAPINQMAMRFNLYFLLFVPILIPKVANMAHGEDSNIIFVSKIVMIGFFLFYFFLSAYSGDDPLHVFPYVPFWR